MALTSEQTSVAYEPDGLEKVFPLPFTVFHEDDVRAVAVDGLRETSLDGYAVEGVGSGSGVRVRFFTPPDFGVKLVLYRWTRRVQESDYPEGGTFPSDVVERDYDRLVAMAQETDDVLQTVIRVPRESAEAPVEFLERFFATAEGAAASRAGAEAAASNAAASAKGAAQNVADAVANALGNAEASASAAHNAAANAAGSATTAAASAEAAAQSAQNVADYLSDGVPTASETQKGIVRLATSAEAAAGTNDNAAMTPLKTKTVLDILAAKKVNYTDFTQLLGYNAGWVKLPNGMLLQWGKTASANAGNTTVTFSIAFPNVCLHCVGIGRSAGAGEQGYATVNFTTQSQAVFNCFKAMSGLAPSLAAQGAVDVWWLAIGY